MLYSTLTNFFYNFSVILETIIGDKQEMMAPIGSNRMPPLTQVQKRLLMLTISLAQHNKQVYDEVLNSLEESLASFRDKTLNVRWIKPFCIYSFVLRFLVIHILYVFYFTSGGKRL